MIACQTVNKNVIRKHYNLATLFYWLLWGRHIHHGYWDADESPRIAQDQLIDRLAIAAGITAGQAVLDVGCGMGGSSCHLAANYGCDVTGVTISPVQHRWATLSSWRQRLTNHTRFLCQDAETMEFTPRSFDALWSIECTEHLFDKPTYFRRAAEWLKPGGTMAICAWLSGDELDATRRRQVLDVCEGFFCPSLGTSGDYQQWFREAGLTVEIADDWTDHVTQTWEICCDRIRRMGVRSVAHVLDRGQLIFLDRFQTILDAYRSGAMKYGCFVGRKPAA